MYLWICSCGSRQEVTQGLQWQFQIKEKLILWRELVITVNCKRPSSHFEDATELLLMTKKIICQAYVQLEEHSPLAALCCLDVLGYKPPKLLCSLCWRFMYLFSAENECHWGSQIKLKIILLMSLAMQNSIWWEPTEQVKTWCWICRSESVHCVRWNCSKHHYFTW